MIRCYICDGELEDCEARYVDDIPYCDHCFDERYEYCFVCESIIDRENDDWYDDGIGNMICNSCYNKQKKKSKYPVNPDVNDNDRAVVLKLAKQYVQTLNTDKFTLRTKPDDYRMKEIAEAVGKISKPIYLFGIKDEKSYRILATQDILDLVIKYFEDKTHIVNRKEIVQNKGYLRLGLDHALRTIHFDKCVELIKYISANKHIIKKVNVRVERAHTNDPEIVSNVIAANNEVNYEELVGELARGERVTITGTELLVLIRTEPDRIQSLGTHRYQDRVTNAVYAYIPDNLSGEYRVEQPYSVRPSIEGLARTWRSLTDAITGREV